MKYFIYEIKGSHASINSTHKNFLFTYDTGTRSHAKHLIQESKFHMPYEILKGVWQKAYLQSFEMKAMLRVHAQQKRLSG